MLAGGEVTHYLAYSMPSEVGWQITPSCSVPKALEDFEQVIDEDEDDRDDDEAEDGGGHQTANDDDRHRLTETWVAAADAEGHG